ncbi:uncharacterized protein LOC131036141 [Cryptomeria japonica]|uniref:uncharacterized protein LOC131036141 n=1 Tax=Cryptomeria japonica TaxID=3369 RepID=UPI0025ABFDB8|nr:uncharacterized protein LOC131036141 [Cryptomeria japonica]
MDNEESSSYQYENSEEFKDESTGNEVDTQRESSQQDIPESSHAQAKKRKREKDNSALQKKQKSAKTPSTTSGPSGGEVNIFVDMNTTLKGKNILLEDGGVIHNTQDRRSVNESNDTNQQEEQEVNSPPHDEEPIYDQQINANEEVQDMNDDNQDQEPHEDTFMAHKGNQQQSDLEEVDDQALEWLRERMKKKPVTIVDEVRDLDTLLARVE